MPADALDEAATLAVVAIGGGAGGVGWDELRDLLEAAFHGRRPGRERA
jgi:hypothetical protein